MSSKQDPHEYVEYLQEIRNDLERMSVQMSDEQFMMHILDTLPPSYEAVAEVMRDKVNEEETNIDNLTGDLMARHSKLRESNKTQWKHKHRKHDEIGLAAYGQFKGKCHNYGKRGHKTTDCYQKNENYKKKGANQKEGSGSFNGNCYHCDEKGHRANVCRKKRENRNNGRDELIDDDDVGLYCTNVHEDLMLRHN